MAWRWCGLEAEDGLVLVEGGDSVCALGVDELGGVEESAGGDAGCATAKLAAPIHAAANVAILKFMAVPLS